MNIRLIHSLVRRPVARVLAIAAAATMTAFCGSNASAQSGLVGHLSGGQATHAAATFGPGTKIIPASAVRTAADVQADRLGPGQISQAVATMSGNQSNAGDIAQVSYGCQSCMQPACNGGCNSCGPAGYGGVPFGGGAYGGSMACGIPCDPYHYVVVEGLYMERDGNSGFNLTRFNRLDDFDFEWMSRVTIGTLPNCVNGWEFTFVGPTEWNRNLTVTDANVPGNIDSFLFDGDGTPRDGNGVPNQSLDPNNFDGTFLDPFQDANIHTQFYNSEYWSGEINKTLVGWDVARVLLGARVIRVEEDYGFASQKDIFASSADLVSRTENTYAGIQAGLDLLYPLAQHVYSDFRGRAGLFYNFADSDVRLRNGGTLILHHIRDDEEFAGVFELGAGLRWQIGPNLAIRGGAEIWYITNAATAAGQLTNAVTNQLGARTDIDDDLLYYGGTAGVELRF